MRGWLLSIFGFVLVAGILFPILLLFSTSRPSLWLVIAFSIAFYLLLGFSPRVNSSARAGFSLVFGAGACFLWIISGPANWNHGLRQVLQLLTYSLAIPFAVGIGICWRANSNHPQEDRPRLIPILVLMGLGWVISYLSSSHGGASPMVDWVMRVLGLEKASAETLIVVARKVTHFCFYGFVALVGMALARKNGAATKLALAAGLLSALAFASFDESRQSTEPDRGGSAWDVLLDMSGAVTTLAIAYSLTRRGEANGPKGTRNSSKL